MIHEYNSFAAAEVSVKNAQKKMKKFYTEINLKEKFEKNSDSSSFKNIEKNNFEVVISFDEKKKITKMRMMISLLIMSKIFI